MFPRSKAHCAYCQVKETWFDIAVIERMPTKVFFLYLKYITPVECFLGAPARWWHERNHLPEEDVAKKKWIKALKVGDVVCDCRWKHLAIKEFEDADDVILEDGSNASLWHCCSPADHPESAHDKDRKNMEKDGYVFNEDGYLEEWPNGT